MWFGEKSVEDIAAVFIFYGTTIIWFINWSTTLFPMFWFVQDTGSCILQLCEGLKYFLVNGHEK